MMRYLVKRRDRIFVKGYRLLSLVKIWGKAFVKILAKI